MFNVHRWFHWFSDVQEDDEHHAIVVVAQGNSLSELAKDLTGDESRWHELVDANPSETFDVNYTLTIGERLRVPKSWGEG